MIKLLALLALVILSTALPYADQMALANSLIVGRDDQSDLYNWQCKVCDASNKPKHAHFIQQGAKDIKCIISVYNEFVVLAFRYTNTALNVWQDILYPLQINDEHTCSNCKVQKAYNNMWQTIKLQVLADLRDIKKSTKLTTLLITGISMGGGLSVISFIDINHADIFENVKITTFGAPRVGNKHWAAHFDLITGRRSRRFYVKDDPIIVLPRCLTLLCTYRQTGIGIVCFEDEKRCVQEESMPELSSLRSAIQHNEFNDVGSLVDHAQGYPKIYNHTLQIDL